MRSSGIENVLSQAEMCLSGTAKKIKAGKDYYLMVRAHILLGTAVFELLWEAVENLIVEESAELDTTAQLNIVIDNFLEVLLSANKESGANLYASNDASKCMKKVKQILEGSRLTECS